MFSILSPLALFAALGILIPVLIHLWNIKSGKTLKIGSIALLGDPSNQRSSSFRITDWPLLLLRCLLILCVAMILADPVHQAKLDVSERPGWILVEKGYFKKLWNSQRKQLDSLLAKGYEIHDFDVNFRKLELADTLSVFSSSAEAPLTYYGLLKQLETQLEPGRKVYLYVHNRSARFASKAPQVKLDLHWNLLPAATADTSWNVGLYQTVNQTVAGVTAHSSATGTYYQTAILKASDTAGMVVDTTTIQVQIYAEPGTKDAQYVDASVRAIRQYTKHKISISHIRSLQNTKQKAMVFWLSSKAPTAAEINKVHDGTRFFQYAGGRVERQASSIQDLNGVSLEQSELYKRTAYPAGAGGGIWSDASGTPLLSNEIVQRKQVFKFYSRFRPYWTNLVWSDNMVLFLLPVILPEANSITAFQRDRRSLASIMEPNLPTAEHNEKGRADVFVQRAISTWFWWMAFVLLILERWLSYRKNMRLQ